MAEETTLPEHWQELPEVKSLVQQTVEQAVAEVRTSLTAVAKERDRLKEELAGLAEKLEQQKAEADRDPASGAAVGGAGADQERKRLEARAKQLQERVAALEKELQAKNRRLAEEVLERGIREAVAAVGDVHKDAWKDVIARGKAVFSLDEQGQPVPRDAAGELIYGPEGLAPMTFGQWAQKLMTEAPHLFKASGSAGSGAAGGKGAGQGAKTVTLSRDEARNPLAYRKAKENAARLGAELIIL